MGDHPPRNTINQVQRAHRPTMGIRQGLAGCQQAHQGPGRHPLRRPHRAAMAGPAPAFGNPNTVYHYFAKWTKNGTTLTRLRRDRVASPSLPILDGQGTGCAPFTGRDKGGHKRVNGRKRHIVVDGKGLPVAVHVTAANAAAAFYDWRVDTTRAPPPKTAQRCFCPKRTAGRWGAPSVGPTFTAGCQRVTGKRPPPLLLSRWLSVP